MKPSDRSLAEAFRRERARAVAEFRKLDDHVRQKPAHGSPAHDLMRQIYFMGRIITEAETLEREQVPA